MLRSHGNAVVQPSFHCLLKSAAAECALLRAVRLLHDRRVVVRAGDVVLRLDYSVRPRLDDVREGEQNLSSQAPAHVQGKGTLTPFLSRSCPQSADTTGYSESQALGA